MVSIESQKNYLAFVKRTISAKDNPIVRKDARLCATLDQENYEYSPQDERNEEWVTTAEASQSMENAAARPSPAFVLKLNDG